VIKKHPLNLQAIFWILACKFSFVIMMAMGKASSLPTMQINFFRSFSICLIAGCMVFFNKDLTFKTSNPKLQLLKVSVGAFGMIGYFYAFRYLEMAQAATLSFSQALLLPIFAFLVLGEKIGKGRIAALIVGYTGTLIALNPVYGTFNAPEIIMLIASGCGAFAVVCAKKLTAKDSPILLMFYSGLATSVLLGLYYTLKGDMIDFGPEGEWRALTMDDAKFFAMLVFISFIMQYSYIKAYSLADVGFLAPFDYLKLIISSVFSLLIFHQAPSIETILGAALIVGSTLYLTKKDIHKDPQYRYKDTP
jgi:drug/metabolite transporter (DMT)-like permease